MDKPGPSPSRLRALRRLASLALLAVAGCGEPRQAPSLPPQALASRVDVFVSARGAEPALGLRLQTVELRDAQGGLVPLPVTRPEVASREAVRRLSVAGGTVPSGEYGALRLLVEAAWLERPEGRVPLRLGGEPGVPPELAGAPTPLEVEVPVRLSLGRRDAASVFLDWDVAASLVGDALAPAFGVTLEAPRVRLGLLYVADEASGSVLSVERSSGQVVATAKAGDKPAALALARDRRDLFVANAGDGSVTILDTTRNAPRLSLPVRLGAGTSDIVVAEEGRLLAVTNPELDTLSFFDVRSGERVADLRTGRGPRRLVAAPTLRRLFVLNARSDSLTVVDVASRSVIATLQVETEPSDLALSRNERELFVGHRTSPSLLVLDAASLQPLPKIHVGDDVSAVLADRRFDRVYVARGRPSELALVDRTMGAVIRRIPVAGRIEALTQPLDGPLVYGAVPDRAGLSVVDVLLGRELQLLPCGAVPVHVLAVD